MTSNREFYFGLMRVSMLQLLKAQGFDKSKPSTVNMVTDLYIRFLELLTGEIIKLANARQDQNDYIALQDITLAFQNLGLIKPVDILDVYDENSELPSDLGLQNFKDWCLNNTQRQDEYMVSLPTTDLLEMSGKTSKQPLSLIPEYINQLQHKEEDDEKDEDENLLLEELVNDGDFDNWIRFVMVKQRINLSKKLSKNRLHNIESLPTIPGLKYSSMEPMAYQNIINNDLIPTSRNVEESNEAPEYLKYETELLRKLPIMMSDSKLENIVLSFENMDNNSDGSYVPAGSDIEPTDTNEEMMDDNIPFNEVQDEVIGSFSLDANLNTQFAEMEDMDNTFQRRNSLDFTDGQRFNHF